VENTELAEEAMSRLKSAESQCEALHRFMTDLVNDVRSEMRNPDWTSVQSKAIHFAIVGWVDDVENLAGDAARQAAVLRDRLFEAFREGPDMPNFDED
jgi:hypothetical protein